MDNNLLSIIKKEKENLIENKNDNNLQLSFDVNVKVENNCRLDPGLDWSLQNVLLNNYQEPLNYDNLKEEIIFSCSICSEYFINSFSLYKHNLKHLKVPLLRLKFYLCDACPNFYKTKNDLRKHIMTTHIGKTLYNGTNAKTASLHKCKICKKVYPYKSWFEHSRTVHSQNKIWECDKCGRLFKCKRYLKKHIMYVHNGVKRLRRGQRSAPKREHNIQCPKCARSFSWKHSLIRHINNFHSENTSQCKICKSILKSKQYLEIHMKRVHYDDGKIHYCHICGKIFKCPTYVRVHIRNSHTCVNIKCPKCPRNLSCESSLTTHLRNCHSENTFQCKICKSILKSKPYLSTHMKRVHYDDGKLHYCDICGKIFKSLRYVRLHIKKTHTYLK